MEKITKRDERKREMIDHDSNTGGICDPDAVNSYEDALYKHGQAYVEAWRAIMDAREYLVSAQKVSEGNAEPVSLEKCKDAVASLPGHYDVHEDVIKAVLDAAGVRYSE